MGSSESMKLELPLLGGANLGIVKIINDRGGLLSSEQKVEECPSLCSG